MGLPSGQRLHNKLEHHHAKGKTHVISTAMFHSYVSLAQALINHKKLDLVGGFNPSKKYEFVNWDDEIPN